MILRREHISDRKITTFFSFDQTFCHFFTEKRAFLAKKCSFWQHFDHKTVQ